MKLKKVIIDTVATMSCLSLVASIVLVLAGNFTTYGVKTVQFNLEENNLLKIENFDMSISIGEVGFLGVVIGILSILLPCYIAFSQSKNKHYYLVLGYIIPLIIILLPKFINNNILNMIAYFFLLLYVNPYYTLLSLLPFSMSMNVYFGFGMIGLLVLISTIVGVIVNKLKTNIE